MLPETEQRTATSRAAGAHVSHPRTALQHAHAVAARARRPHPSRPTTLDYIERLFTDFVEIHGDRRFARRSRHGLRHGALRGRASRWSSVTRRGATPSRRSTATSATPAPKATARRCARCSWRRSSTARSSASSTRPPPIPASNPRSAASPRRSPSTCARWRC